MTQKELKNYVTRQLHKTHDRVIVGDGYVYAQGEFPVLLVAHLDTVHDRVPQLFVYDKNKTIISSPQGIGGDDRCGVYMIFEVIKKFNCSVLFCEDEEIGGIGAEKFIQTDLAQTLSFNYMIEFDRKGSNDAVFYDCDNPEFEEFITKEFHKTAYGTFSDISYLAPYIECAAVNLSCGYYQAHTTSEYVVLKEMQDSIDAACNILARTTEEDKFEYVEAVHYTNLFDDKLTTQYDDYYLIEYLDIDDQLQWYETYAFTKAEAIGQFCIDNPDLSYSSIMDISCNTNWY
jgi:hypothetical protein